jgi:hypothetical protein
MSTPWPDDDRLLEDLRAVFRETGPVPPEVITAGKAAFELRTLDLELALLTYDSEGDPELADAFRGNGLAVRRMVFSLDGTSIDVDVLADSLVGQISPATSGRIVLETRDGQSTAADVDVSGMFTLALTRPAEIRLRVEPIDRRPFVTEWARV